jgi:putative endonuclease
VPNARHALGERAEHAAAEWLTSRGWRILARRWRCPEGELDLVVLDPGRVVVAIEVKVRRTGRAGAPLDTIDRRRLRRLRAALGHFVAEMPAAAGEGIRVDLVAVHPGDAGRWRLTHHHAIDAW